MSGPPPPPQVSPDGKFYWDGAHWVPMPAQAASAPGQMPLWALQLFAALPTLLGMEVFKDREASQPKARASAKRYLELAAQDLRRNLRVAWPIFAAMSLFVPVSTTLLYLFEHSRNSRIGSWWDALYFTWVTMATVSNAEPLSWLGRLVTAFDVLVGLLAIGVIVWLITMSLTQTSIEAGLVSEIVARVRQGLESG